VFLVVLAVAVTVVATVTWLGTGAAPPALRLDPAPTAPVPGPSPTDEESTSAEPRPDTSRPARSSSRPSPPASPTASATAGPTPSAPPVGVTPVPTPPPAAYEAEGDEHARGSGVAIRNQSGASGGRVVGNVGNQAAATLRFNGVRAHSGGRYTMTIYYLSGTSRSASIRVNNGVPTMVAFTSTGGFDRVGSRTFNVDLLAGTNTIEFGNPTNWAPDFDRIVV
jgi:hypothetical protein